MDFKSFAKVNLHLDIVSRRPDGYHNLESIFVKIDLHDNLTIIENGVGLTLDYYEKVSWTIEQDILYKTYHKYCDNMQIKPNIYIKIDKKIPDKAGLGGASSNAATLLYYLHTYVKPCSNLVKLASSLGADIPFFLQDSNYALIEGIGDIITPLNNCIYNSYDLIIIKPDFGISTMEAFASIEVNKYPVLGKDKLISYFEKGNLDGMHNHFAMSLEDKHPSIKIIKNELYNLGANYAELTGSGSAVVGYFRTPISDLTQKYSISKALKTYGKIYFSKIL